jgi:uncharacterized cupredoxin-like copper-binding protein
MKIVKMLWLLPATIVLAGAMMNFAIACSSDDNDGGDNGGEPTATEPMNETPMETMASMETPMETDEHMDGMTPEANEVHVALDEYSITNEMGDDDALPSPHAGTVAFEGHNHGQLAHSLLIIKTDLAEDELPMDGELVDEAAVEVVAEIENIAIDEAEVTSADLEAGNYVLICNVSGHYAQGMHATLTVQ